MNTLKRILRFIKITLQVWFVMLALAAASIYAAGRFGVIDPIRPYVVMSGSMEPAIATGSVVFSQAKELGYAVGDVVTFARGASANSTTHRIVELVDENGVLAYKTKGDANDTVDGAIVKRDDIIGAVFLQAPHVGYAVDFAKQPYGFILLVIIPATIIVYEELKTIAGELKKLVRRMFGKEEDSIASIRQAQDKSLQNDNVHAVVGSEESGVSERDSSASLGMTIQPTAEANFSPVMAEEIPTVTKTIHLPVSEPENKFNAPLPPENHEMAELFSDSRDSIASIRQAQDKSLQNDNVHAVVGSQESGVSERDISTAVEMTPQMQQPKVVAREPKKSPWRLPRIFGLAPVLGAVAIFLGVSGSFFLDSEFSAGNILGAAATFIDQGGPTPTPTPTPPPNPIAQTLVINEVVPASTCSQGNTEAQWLEVYNGFNVQVDLKNFQITDGVNTVDLVTAVTLVDPGELILLAHNSAIFGNGPQSCWPDLGADNVNLGGQLDINTGILKLLDASAVVIDRVEWGGVTGLSPALDESIERAPAIGTDSALGDTFSSSDFIIMSTPSPGL